MSEHVQAKMKAWLAGEFRREEKRMCIRLDLFVAPPNGGRSTVQTWFREEPQHTDKFGPGDIKADLFAHEITAAAADYANGDGVGTYRFELRSTQHYGGTVKHAFRIIADGAADDPNGSGGPVGFVEDTPDAQGVLAQTIRHNEVLMRWSMSLAQASTGSLMQRLDAESEMNTRMIQDHRNYQIEVEKARSLENEREIAGMKMISSEARKDKIVGKVIQILPVVANRLAAKLMPGKPGGGLGVLVGALKESISQDQIMRIAAQLSVEQQVLLGEIFTTVAEQEKAVAAEEKKSEAAEATEETAMQKRGA